MHRYRKQIVLIPYIAEDITPQYWDVDPQFLKNCQNRIERGFVLGVEEIEAVLLAAKKVSEDDTK